MNFPGVPSHRNETMKRCILCLAALSLAACGASGPLYLPGHQKPHSNVLRKQQDKTGPSSPASAPAASPADAPASAPPQQPQSGAPDAGAAPKPAVPGPAPNSDSTPPPQP